MTPDRRDVLKGIGAAGSVVLVGSNISTAVPGDRAKVRVVHASPDAPNVDVYVDGSKVLSDVAFNTVSSYLEVPTGERQVTITAAGDPSTVAFEGPVTVSGGTLYTVAAIGELSEGTFRPTVLEDRQISSNRNSALFRPVHASPDAPAVDVTLFGYSLYEGVEFGDVGHYATLTPYDYHVGVEPAAGQDPDPVIQQDLALEAGVTYTAFVTGYLSPDDEPTDESLGFLPASSQDDTGGGSDTGQVRVAHASPDAPNVDIYVDGSKVLSNVPFTTISDYLEVPSGERTVKITAAGDPSTVAFEGPVTVDPDTAYTVAAIGELSEGTFRPTVLVDDADPGFGEGALRVLHASPDAPAVDITTEHPDTTLVDGLTFGDATDYASVQPGRYELEVRPDSPGNDNPFDAEFHATVPSEPVTAIATGYFTAFDEPADEQFTLELARDATADD